MKKSAYAVASITLGILSFIQIFGLEKALAAGAFGAMALYEMKNDETLGGRRIAVAGLVLGGLYIVAVGILFFMKGGEIVSLLRRVK